MNSSNQIEINILQEKNKHLYKNYSNIKQNKTHNAYYDCCSNFCLFFIGIISYFTLFFLFLATLYGFYLLGKFIMTVI